ncbi:site-2 protease family protein [Sphingomonas sp. LaA6.9]|uniref:site-2 protease family protein n=1 Tax=Sphingomonas sp. LaA6.9 TaxID=2919914 RepID=UPI001F50225A|nr:site-2 protease family protein [Sphingomonas sp. LaA6.9]MCJ8156851.1 site-2 protease family protein [Sphingomonas sp. LaA6.9]
MSWSFSIGTVKGTVIRIHVTLLLFLLWIAAMSYAQAGMPAAVWGLAFFALLFLCVVLHEFGHILTALHFGVRTPDVTLLPIGGVARMDRMPEKPQQELLIALAGPMVNLVIAAVLVLYLGGLPAPGLVLAADPRPGLIEMLALANLSLAIFNLIPAFPMDGGRALRALLAVRMGHARATRVAATMGQIIAFLFGIFGVMMGHFILVLIAVFIYMAAGAEAGLAQLRRATAGRTAADLMITSFESLAIDAPLSAAADGLIRTAQHEFPVVDRTGHLRGLLTRDRIIKALQQGSEHIVVGDVMQADFPSIPAGASAEEAVRLLEQGAAAVEVADAEGKIAGFVTWENLLEFLLIEEARHGGRQKPALSGTSLPVSVPRSRHLTS